MRPALTSLDRVLWPQTGFTEGDMLAYYEAIAPFLVPHLAGRPLTLGRFPSGIEGPGFATTECRGRPHWVRTMAVPLRSGEVREQCVVHGLDEAGLRSFAKTSGGTGLHVYVPLAPGHDFGASKGFARLLASRLARELPDAVTDRRDRGARRGRVLVDWLPNAPRSLTVTPYSLRAADVPAVSAPVSWGEVEAAAVGGHPQPLRLGPAETLARARAAGDLFRPVIELEQSLPG